MVLVIPHSRHVVVVVLEPQLALLEHSIDGVAIWFASVSPIAIDYWMMVKQFLLKVAIEVLEDEWELQSSQSKLAEWVLD